MTITFTLNGKGVTLNVEAERRLVDILREDLHLTRTKSGCYIGECGACTVLLEGSLAPACLLPAFALRGANVVTFEGFARTRDYGEISRAFAEAGYLPCSYCAQGRVLAVHALLERMTDPKEPDILAALSGLSCQCSDYSSLVRAVEIAAAARKRRRGTAREGADPMIEIEGATHVYSPTTMNELLSLFSKVPTALIFNGGTHILRRQEAKFVRLPANVISLARIEELSRISRTERHVDVGATATISRILEVGANILPRVLCTALSTFGTPAVRNRATLGGNICIPDRRTNLYPVYLLLDIQLELRRFGASRWIPLNRFAASGRLDFNEGELLTRIRIPFSTWDIEVYRSIEGEIDRVGNILAFCGVARLEKEVINDLRFAFASADGNVFRTRQLENELVGRRLPFAGKEMIPVVETLDATLEEQGRSFTHYQKERMRGILRWFLSRTPAE